MNYTETFYKLTASKNLWLPDDFFYLFELNKIVSYYSFLIENNDRFGFFSKNEQNQIFERHIYESLIFIYLLHKKGYVSRETKIADAGSGQGIPGILFGFLKEHSSITLIDSSKRRLGKVEKFTKEIGLSNIRYIYGRLEELKKQFDLITIRALIKIPYSLELICKLQKKGGFTVYFSGKNTQENWQDKKYLDLLGYKLKEALLPYEKAKLGGKSLYIFEKFKKTEKGYPRIWKKIKEEING